MNTTLKLALACFAGCLAAYSPAQGPSQDHGWQVRLLPTGTSYKHHQYASEGMTPLTDWSTLATGWVWGSAEFSNSLSDGLNEEDDWWLVYPLGITLSGGVKPEFRWIAGPDMKPEPAHLYVRHTATASHGSLDHYPDGSLNNGLGSDLYYYLYKIAQSGSKVFKLEGPGVIEMPTSMLYADAYSSSLHMSPFGTVSFKTEVLPYPYVTGSFSKDMIGNFRKGANGERVRNLPSPEKLIAVDVGLNWDDVSDFWTVDVDLRLDQNIYGSPKRAWAHTGGASVFFPYWHFFDPSNDYETIAPYMYVEHGNGQTCGKTTTFTVTLTDRNDPGNPAIVIPYVVRWHYKYENWFKFQPTESYEKAAIHRYGEPVEGARDGGMYHFWFTEYESQFGYFLQGFSGISGVISNFIPHPGWAGLISLLGLVIDQFAPKDDEEWASFDDHWDKATSTFEPYKVDNRRGQYRMKANVFVEHDIHYVQSDHYEGTGYQGQLQRVVDLRTPTERVNGHFQLVGSSNDPPYYDQ